MTKEEFSKLEWQQISYAEADAGSCTWEHHRDRKSTRLNSSHSGESRMPSSA